MGRLTDAIKHLLIINVLFFGATMLFGDQLYQWFSLWFPQNQNFQFWQVITHMFMHGGLMHIAFNMYALWAFGTPLERMWGRNKFLFFYLSAGLGAALLHTGINYYYLNEGLTAVLSSGIAEADVFEILAQGKYMPDWYNMASESTIQNFLDAYNTPDAYLFAGTCKSQVFCTGIVALRFIFRNYRLRHFWPRNRALCPYWRRYSRFYDDVVLEKKSV